MLSSSLLARGRFHYIILWIILHSLRETLSKKEYKISNIELVGKVNIYLEGDHATVHLEALNFSNFTINLLLSMAFNILKKSEVWFGSLGGQHFIPVLNAIENFFFNAWNLRFSWDKSRFWSPIISYLISGGICRFRSFTSGKFSPIISLIFGLSFRTFVFSSRKFLVASL